MLVAFMSIFMIYSHTGIMHYICSILPQAIIYLLGIILNILGWIYVQKHNRQFQKHNWPKLKQCQHNVQIATI